MARSGQDSRGSREALTTTGSSQSAQRSYTPTVRDNRAAWRLVSLAVLLHMLRSRRFQELAAVAVIALVALAGLRRENQAKMIARLVAWNARQAKRFEHEAERQVRKLERRVT